MLYLVRGDYGPHTSWHCVVSTAGDEESARCLAEKLMLDGDAINRGQITSVLKLEDKGKEAVIARWVSI